MLGEITQNIKDEWADAYNPSGFRHGVSEAPIYLYRELANGLVSVLARALNVEHFYDAQVSHKHRCPECYWTDSDWLAEAERILKK